MGHEEGCSSFGEWVQLPLSTAAMQCNNSQRLPFGIAPRRISLDTLLIFTLMSCRFLHTWRKAAKPCVLHFSFFIFVFHIAYSQQFIQSTVIIVLTLQTRRVRHSSSPVRRSCIKVHNKQNSSLPYLFIRKYNICVSLNISFHIQYLWQSLARHWFDISTLEGLRRCSRVLLPPSAGILFKCTWYWLRAVVTFW